MKELCAQCGKTGKLGNDIRDYTITSPLSVFHKLLCWKCFLKQDRKQRPHVHIKDSALA